MTIFPGILEKMKRILSPPSKMMLSSRLTLYIVPLPVRDIVGHPERRKLEDARDVKSDHARRNVSPQTAL